MNNLQTHKCLGVDERINCDNMPKPLEIPRVILASKLSLIIIGLCGPVELV